VLPGDKLAMACRFNSSGVVSKHSLSVGVLSRSKAARALGSPDVLCGRLTCIGYENSIIEHRRSALLQDHAVHAGATHADEMCNLYLMLYSQLPVFSWCLDGREWVEVGASWACDQCLGCCAAG
jgi:hypothetical protein